jgi:hypothetical protein
MPNRAPGGGRKCRGEGPSVHFNSRITPETRRVLEAAAKRNGRSLSHEIELRLAHSAATISDFMTTTVPIGMEEG